MRFKTEFESMYEGSDHPKYGAMIKAYEGRGQMYIGNMIADSFKWKQDGQRFKIQHSLEIEAFPMNKWIEFKNALFCTLEPSDADGITILKLIKELESFGKPAISEKKV